MITLQLTSYQTNQVLFEHTCPDNTIQKTLAQAVQNRVNLDNVNLTGVTLTRESLRGISLQGAVFLGANLVETTFAGSGLSRSNFIQAKLGGASFKDAYLDQASLQSANLRGSNLSGASLVGANLAYADLSGAMLAEACFTNALTRYTNLEGATLKNGEKLLKGNSIVQVNALSEGVVTAYFTDMGVRYDYSSFTQVPKEDLPSHKDLAFAVKMLEELYQE